LRIVLALSAIRCVRVWAAGVFLGAWELSLRPQKKVPLISLCCPS